MYHTPTTRAAETIRELDEDVCIKVSTLKAFTTASRFTTSAEKSTGPCAPGVGSHSSELRVIEGPRKSFTISKFCAVVNNKFAFQRN
jgi:hypothetical protein